MSCDWLVFLFARLRRRPRGPSPGLWPPSPRGRGIRWESTHGGRSSPLSRARRLARRAQLRRGGGAGVGVYQVVVPLRHRPNGPRPVDRSCSFHMSCPSDSKPHTDIKSNTISTTGLFSHIIALKLDQFHVVDSCQLARRLVAFLRSNRSEPGRSALSSH